MKRSILMAIVALAIVASACGEGNVFSLEVGTCFDDPDAASGEVSDVPVVECSEPHDNEVYYLFDLPDGDFPGTASVENSAQDGCLAQFEAYVGEPYETSVLGIWPLYPTAGSWDQGDREIVCVLYDIDGTPLTGSVRGSGI